MIKDIENYIDKAPKKVLKDIFDNGRIYVINDDGEWIIDEDWEKEVLGFLEESKQEIEEEIFEDPTYPIPEIPLTAEEIKTALTLSLKRTEGLTIKAAEKTASEEIREKIRKD